jgi:hypothetical protein
MDGLMAKASAPPNSPDASLTAADWKPELFDAHQNETVVVLSDFMIPAADTPGARATLANRFIDLLLSASECEVRRIFWKP